MKPRSIVRVFLFSLISLALVVSCAQPTPTPPPPTKAPVAPQPTAAAKPTAEAKPTVAEAKPTAAPAAPTPTTAAAKPTAAPASSAPEKPFDPAQKVTIGVLGTVSNGPVYIAMEKGYFKEAGFVPELTTFQSGALMIPPLAAGQLDMGMGGISAGLFNAMKRDIPIEIVADSASTVKGWPSISLVVRKDLIDSGAIKDYKDLKGKTIAINIKGSSSELTLELALAKGGLKLSDVNMVVMGFPDMNVAMGNKAIDAAIQLEPFRTVGVDMGIHKDWKGEDDWYPNHQISAVLYSPQFAKKEELAKRFMLVFLKGQREYNDAFGPQKKNRAEVVSILTKHTTTKDAAMYDKMIVSHLNPDGYVFADSLTFDLDWYVKQGLVKEPPDLKTHINNKYVDDVIQRLGKYQR